MINIAELLKDAPKGMKLYSPICGHCKLSRILYDDGIRVIAHDVPFRFDKYGRFCSADDAECLLFPSKDCTWDGWEAQIKHKFNIGDWITSIDDEGDVSTEKVVSFTCNKVMLVDTDGCHTTYPKTELSGYRLWSFKDAKDGDVLISDKDNPFIFCEDRIHAGYHNIIAYCGITTMGSFCESSCKECWTYGASLKPATKEQRDLLFKKMREAGYIWDADKKELRKTKPHYDIANFHTGMPVLVREYDTCHWSWVLYSHFNGVGLFFAAGKTWRQCIPYEGNEHLLGTTDMPSEEYINW